MRSARQQGKFTSYLQHARACNLPYVELQPSPLLLVIYCLQVHDLAAFTSRDTAFGTSDTHHSSHYTMEEWFVEERHQQGQAGALGLAFLAHLTGYLVTSQISILKLNNLPLFPAEHSTLASMKSMKSKTSACNEHVMSTQHTHR
ncbi:hypothetical protein BDV93DRAFT_515400 [Ceratobasidium sp. AG-I]|nr:hypothetical protein BDV93DRAFT_515400 [Ceratobasidium sp. AG-I]